MNQKLPDHVAVIMDGNGRWAERRGQARAIGHIRGARVAKKIITTAVDLKIKNLTLFAFSTENWLRPAQEIMLLMRLLRRQLIRETELLFEKNVRFRAIGEIHRLPPAVQDVLHYAIKRTENNTGLNLVFAISYGGRQEIVKAAQSLVKKVLDSSLSIDDITEETFASALESQFLPDPDLIIRTSGESRLSNFYLWQSAYSEIFIHDKFWPDFTPEDFQLALKDYSRRERRLGRVTPVSAELIQNQI